MFCIYYSYNKLECCALNQHFETILDPTDTILAATSSFVISIIASFKVSSCFQLFIDVTQLLQKAVVWSNFSCLADQSKCLLHSHVTL